MSFSTLVPLIQYTGNGSTTVFAFAHKYYSDEDIIVVLTSALDVDTVQTITTEYTLSGKAADAHATTTGSVTMLTPPAGGGTPEKLTIYRKPALTQITTLLNTGAWYALPLELRLDLIVMMIQEHELQLGRTAQNAVTNTDTPISLEALVLLSGGSLISDLTGKAAMVDADLLRLGDSADSFAEKKILVSAAWTYMLTKIAANAVVAKIITFGALVANTGTTPTINWGAGQKQLLTLTGNTVLNDPMTAPAGPCNLMLKVVQAGTGSYTVTWPAAVRWPGGTAPTLSAAVGAVDWIAFVYDGTNYDGQFGLDFQ